MFDVDDIDVVVARMRAHGPSSSVAYIRGPEGIIVRLGEAL